MIDLNTIQYKPLPNDSSETKCFFKLHFEVFLSSCLRLLEALLKIRIYTGEFFATRFHRVFMRKNLSRRVVTHTRRDSLAAIAFGKNRRRVSNICDLRCRLYFARLNARIVLACDHLHEVDFNVSRIPGQSRTCKQLIVCNLQVAQA